MSILIKGMKMPTSCHDCRFCGWSNFWQVYDCHLAKPNVLLLFNGEKTNSVSKTRNGRADNCPLVPVPDHGRLIDASALLQSIKEARKADQEIADVYDDDYFLVAEWVCSSPTIIPASGGDAE